MGLVDPPGGTPLATGARRPREHPARIPCANRSSRTADNTVEFDLLLALAYATPASTAWAALAAHKTMRAKDCRALRSRGSGGSSARVGVPPKRTGAGPPCPATMRSVAIPRKTAKLRRSSAAPQPGFAWPGAPTAAQRSPPAPVRGVAAGTGPGGRGPADCSIDRWDQRWGVGVLDGHCVSSNGGCVGGRAARAPVGSAGVADPVQRDC